MSFNLMAEGALDYAVVATHVASFVPLEIFPIPPTREGEPPALGIACPKSRCGEDAARALDRIVRFLWAIDAQVYELWGGRVITNDAALAELCTNVK